VYKKYSKDTRKEQVQGGNNYTQAKTQSKVKQRKEYYKHKNKNRGQNTRK
jgi:hypothetical protein